MNQISKSDRVLNYIIDMIIISFLGLILSILFYKLNPRFLIYLTMFFYYLISESLFQKTIGKIITKTHVVDKTGNKPKFRLILMRSFLRIIPIDGLSYLFGSEQGFHDKLSFTRLIKD